MQIQENWSGHPDGKPFLEGVLQKTSGAFAQYSPRYIQLFTEHIYLYQTSQKGGAHDPTPYSRIPLAYVTVANAPDELPTGFVLTTLDGKDSVGFITESVQAKNMWVLKLHEQISALGRNTAHLMNLKTQSSKSAYVNRLTKPVLEGFLQKRQGTFGSYHTRWCEFRAEDKVISYSKYKSSPDDSFKHVSLATGRKIIVNPVKMRFAITTADGLDTVYLKCQDHDDFTNWLNAIKHECGEEVLDVDGDMALSQLASGGGPGGVPLVMADDDDEDEDINLDFDDEDDDGGGVGNGEGEEDGGSEEAYELADLASPEPIRNLKYEEKYSTDPNRAKSSTPQGQGVLAAEDDMSHLSPKLVGYGASSPQNILKPIFLESVLMDFKPKKHTANYYQNEIAPYINAMEFNLQFKMQRFYERMHVPLRGPYSAIYEHINLLDLDAKLLKGILMKLLEKFGHEEAVRPLVSDLDALLRLLPAARKKFLIYREMAEFREQKGKGGLKLGVNGTVHFIDQLTRRTREKPTEEQLAMVERAATSLDSCIEEFRLQFDVYDESIEAIQQMENALAKADEWIGLHKEV